MPGQPSVRLIAFYLPQFHPIPENDLWWGKGFTEWTNVARARPLYPGHLQPHLPSELGFYDLRVPDTRQAQAELARMHGIEAFCYWHYWFAGRRLLERPFTEVLRSGEPDFPFCLAWANQSWTGIWHGAPNRVLIEQTYPGKQDYEAHFYEILPAFADPRYVKIDGKPVFLVYRPYDVPDSWAFTDLWRSLALRAGLAGIYFVGIPSEAWESWSPSENGFDAAVLTNLQPTITRLIGATYGIWDRIAWKISCRTVRTYRDAIRSRLRWPLVSTYKRAIREAISELSSCDMQYPSVMPNWDNTPRSGYRGVVLHGSTPELFGKHLDLTMAQVQARDRDHRMIFVKSWNEWAEGNYLEPDEQHGRAYLEVVKRAVFGNGIR